MLIHCKIESTTWCAIKDRINRQRIRPVLCFLLFPTMLIAWLGMLCAPLILSGMAAISLANLTGVLNMSISRIEAWVSISGWILCVFYGVSWAKKTLISLRQGHIDIDVALQCIGWVASFFLFILVLISVPFLVPQR